MNKLQKGFSLIELMIVVAIIGVLAAIAVPQYNNYIARGQVSEAMVLLAAAKTAIEDDAVQNNLFAGNVLAVAAAMCNVTPDLSTTYGINITGMYVNCISVLMKTVMAGDEPEGQIQAVFNATGVNTELAGKIIVFERDGTGTWSCLDSSGATTVPDSVLPASCK